MIGKAVKEQRPITLAEARSIMEKRKAEGELGFEQQATYDYLKARTLLSEEKSHQMLEELGKVDKLTNEIAIKIVDLLPKTEAQLGAIVAKERHAFTKTEMAEVLKIVEKYASE